MKVILLVDVAGKGKADEVLSVSDGYANNYLLPKNLAVKYSDDALKAILKRRESEERRRLEEERRKEEEEKRRLELEERKRKEEERRLEAERQRLEQERIEEQERKIAQFSRYLPVHSVFDRYFRCILSLQELEDYLYQTCTRSLSDERLKSKLGYSSLNELSKFYLKIIGANGAPRQLCNELEGLFGELQRNKIVHDFTIECDRRIVKQKDENQRAANIQKGKEIIDAAFSVMGNIFQKISAWEGVAPTTRIVKGRKRHIESSGVSQSYSKNNCSREKLQRLCGGADEETILKYYMIPDAYYYLISDMNAIHLRLRKLVWMINRKQGWWTKEEMRLLLEKKDLRACLKTLERETRSNVGLLLYLEKIKDFFTRLKEIVIDRDYWIHYFAIDYYRENRAFYYADGCVDNLLALYNRILFSRAYELSFRKELKSLIRSLQAARQQQGQ